MASSTADLVMALKVTRSTCRVLERLLLVQDLEHVPADRLSLAVGVGGQDDAVRAFGGLGDFGHAFGAAGVDFPFHGEVVVRLDRPVLRRQVADVAVGGENLVSPEPRYLLMVLALAGLSTMTRFITAQSVGEGANVVGAGGRVNQQRLIPYNFP
jgi:hypothetical protein